MLAKSPWKLFYVALKSPWISFSQRWTNHGGVQHVLDAHDHQSGWVPEVTGLTCWFAHLKRCSNNTRVLSHFHLATFLMWQFQWWFQMLKASVFDQRNDGSRSMLGQAEIRLRNLADNKKIEGIFLLYAVCAENAKTLFDVPDNRSSRD